MINPMRITVYHELIELTHGAGLIEWCSVKPVA